MKTSIIPVGKCKAGCEGAISKWDPCCSNCAVTPTHAISLVTLAILHSDCWLGKQQGETCIHTCSNFENIIGISCIMLCCSNAMCAFYANPLIWRSIIVRSSRYYPALEKDQSVDPYLTLAPHEPSSGPNMAPQCFIPPFSTLKCARCPNVATIKMSRFSSLFYILSDARAGLAIRSENILVEDQGSDVI